MLNEKNTDYEVKKVSFYKQFHLDEKVQLLLLFITGTFWADHIIIGVLSLFFLLVVDLIVDYYIEKNIRRINIQSYGHWTVEKIKGIIAILSDFQNKLEEQDKRNVTE